MLKNEKIVANPKYARAIRAPRTVPTEYENSPRNQPRICTIQLNKTDTTFGFDIVYASNTPLRRFDRIIEIDDELMENESTAFVEEKLLKARTRGFIKLYLVDTKTYKFYKTNNLPLSPKESAKKLA
ncbi:unnamed protein product [Adineta ricciae]|uniref:Uncharacterized protein n=1 Tax=Adineta ricciae TaxID=249248 RepID=A0A814Y3I0_ADIRI|nr:unnamed protein product [Adineta ricciae]CAF1451625.1 unnamed protein product [Adineta ricciae]